MTKFDTWLTTQPMEEGMDCVKAGDMMEQDKNCGIIYPIFIDELSCEDCEKGIGWDSDGTFTEFYADDSDKHYKCEDCYDTWLDNRYTE